MAKESTPTTRALRVFQYVLLHGRVQTGGIAAAFDVPPKVALQTLQAIESAGLICTVDAGRKKAWVAAPRVLEDGLDDFDYLSLKLGAEELAFLRGTVLHEGVQNYGDGAYTRVSQRTRGDLERKFVHFAQPCRQYGEHAEIVEVLVDAVMRSLRVKISYRKRPLVEVDPLTLVTYRQALYLLARDRDGKLGRYAVERIGGVMPGGAFVYPSDWDPRAELSGWFGIHAGGERGDVVLRFTAKVAELVYARQWTEDAVLVGLADGGVELRANTGGPELTSWVLSWGGEVQVVGPEWLRAEVRRELLGALGRMG